MLGLVKGREDEAYGRAMKANSSKGQRSKEAGKQVGGDELEKRRVESRRTRVSRMSFIQVKQLEAWPNKGVKEVDLPLHKI